MSTEEIEFVDGMIVKAPRDGAPDFVKGSIAIKRKDLGNWLRGKDEEWINLDIKEARSGRWYVSVDNWKPEQQSSSPQPQPANFDEDVPF